MVYLSRKQKRNKNKSFRVKKTQRGGQLTQIPIFIICWNQYTYVKSMVEQLQKYDINIKIYIIDNKSTYKPLIKYLKTIDGKNGVKVLYQSKNYGHKVYERPEIIEMGGDKYIVTDPDLTLNPDMPKNFLEIMAELSDKYKTNKIGLALDLKNDIDLTKRLDSPTGKTFVENEIQFWQKKQDDPNYELYRAPIDTTFALINTKYPVLGNMNDSIRIAGNFTAVHRPWTLSNKTNVPAEEMEYYLNHKDNISTTLNRWKTKID
jgi:hypothetical protein